MSYPTPSVTGIVLSPDRKILLAKQAGFWGLPGGALEGGLDWLGGLRKSLLETAGVDVKGQKLVGIYSDMESGRLVASFLVTEYGEVGGEGKTFEELEWFAADKLPDPMPDVERARISDALGFKGEVVSR